MSEYEFKQLTADFWRVLRERDEAKAELASVRAQLEQHREDRDALFAAAEAVLDYEHHPSRGSLSYLRSVVLAVQDSAVPAARTPEGDDG